MAMTFTTTQASLAGRTLYAVLSRSGVTLATVAMAEAPAGTFTASVPAGIPAGKLAVVAYRQLGADPDPATDWEVATGVVEAVGAVAGQDMLSAGMGWLTDQMQSHASTPVVYRRGSDTVEVDATLGRKLFKLDEGAGGVLMEWSDKDFLIPTASLVLGGSPTTPRRGDRVEHEGRVYQVLAPGGEPPWQYSDPSRTMLRIHTKLISEG